MQTSTRRAVALLGQNTPVNVKLGLQGVSENITVTAQATLVDKGSTELQSGISQQQIQALPLVQNYGDLQKLVPAVQYTQDSVRGPSAGASGQENVYLFDGANITMPLFGVLLAQPNINDIAQVNITRGGANAVDFNRAGGFQHAVVSAAEPRIRRQAGGDAEPQLPEQQKLGEPEYRRPDPRGSPLLLRFVLPAVRAARECGEPLRHASKLSRRAH